MKPYSARVFLTSRLTAWLDELQEREEPSSDQDEPQNQDKKTTDYTLELEKFRAETYHYRQPVLMYTIAYELEFLGGWPYPPDYLERTGAVVIHGRDVKSDLETLDYLKHDEPTRFQKACVGFEKLYGLSSDRFESRIATVPVEVLGSLMRRVILKYCLGWAKDPEEQRKLIETCDWIINTWLEFPVDVDKFKTSFSDLCRTMGKPKAATQDSVKD